MTGIEKYYFFMDYMSSHELNILRCKNRMWFSNICTIKKTDLFTFGNHINDKIKRKLTNLERKRIIDFKK